MSYFSYHTYIHGTHLMSPITENERDRRITSQIEQARCNRIVEERDYHKAVQKIYILLLLLLYDMCVILYVHKYKYGPMAERGGRGCARGQPCCQNTTLLHTSRPSNTREPRPRATAQGLGNRTYHSAKTTAAAAAPFFDNIRPNYSSSTYI